MKKFVFPLMIAATLTGFTAAAQNDSARAKAELEDLNQAQTKAQKQMEEAERDQSRRIQEMKERQDDLQEKELDMQERVRDAQDHARMAQRRLADAKRKLDDFDEIIIKRKNPEKNERVTIEIKDGQVKVNGKPINDFNNDDVSVQIRSPRRLTLSGPSTPFGNQNSFWRIESDGKEHAMLGVASDGPGNGQAVVGKVTEGSAADKAGLKTGDIITKVDDHSIGDFHQLSDVIDDYKPGDKVTITYKRGGKEKRTKAVLDKRPAGNAFSFRSDDGEGPGELGELAVPIPPIPPIPANPDLNFNFDRSFDGLTNGQPRVGIKAQDTEDGKGVAVLGVDEGSAADKAGLKANDVITSFDGRPVDGADDLKEALKNAKNKPTVKIELKRNGKTENVELKIPRKLKTANL